MKLRIVAVGAVILGVCYPVAAWGNGGEAHTAAFSSSSAVKVIRQQLPRISSNKVLPFFKVANVKCPAKVQSKAGATVKCAVNYDIGTNAEVTLHLASSSGSLRSLTAKDFRVTGKKTAIPDKGDLVLHFGAATGADLQVENTLKKPMTSLINELNGLVALPRNVKVNFAKGTDGPAYFPQAVEIQYPYTFTRQSAALFKKGNKGSTDKQNLQNAAEVDSFVILHETTHALVDQLDIPVTREEDAADNLATILLLLDNKRDGGAIALTAARWWQLSAENGGDPEIEDFADEHSLSRQRFFNILCLVYGSDEKKYSDLLGKYLPEARAVRCQSEFVQSARTWFRLLGPYLKQNPS